MFTTVRLIVLSILALILVVSAWSKLRFLDEGSDQPQRWRLEEYPRCIHGFVDRLCAADPGAGQ